MVQEPRGSRVLGTVKIFALRLHEALETFCEVAVLSVNWTFYSACSTSVAVWGDYSASLGGGYTNYQVYFSEIEDILLLQSSYSRPSPLWRWNWLH